MNKQAQSPTAADLISSLIANMDSGEVVKAMRMSEIALTIFHIRRELHMSQREFAKYLGVSQGMVSRWENGDYNFTVGTLSDICHKLGVSLTINIRTTDTNPYSYKYQKPVVILPVSNDTEKFLGVA
mgnify:CR=1 FL=1